MPVHDKASEHYAVRTCAVRYVCARVCVCACKYVCARVGDPLPLKQLFSSQHLPYHYVTLTAESFKHLL